MIKKVVIASMMVWGAGFAIWDTHQSVPAPVVQTACEAATQRFNEAEKALVDWVAFWGPGSSVVKRLQNELLLANRAQSDACYG